MYPTFCSYDAAAGETPPDAFVLPPGMTLGNARPALAIAEHGDSVDLLVSLNGHTVAAPREAVRLGLPEVVALAMMDAVEEAIEDARDEFPVNDDAVTRLEATLAALERALDM